MRAAGSSTCLTVHPAVVPVTLRMGSDQSVGRQGDAFCQWLIAAVKQYAIRCIVPRGMGIYDSCPS